MNFSVVAEPLDSGLGSSALDSDTAPETSLATNAAVRYYGIKPASCSEGAGGRQPHHAEKEGAVEVMDGLERSLIVICLR